MGRQLVVKTTAGIVLLLSVGLLSAPAQLPSAESPNWPQFRGPDRTAVVPDDPGLPETWSATDGIAWRTAISGRGWSSPIVWGHRVFVTSVSSDTDYDGPKPGLWLPEAGSYVDGRPPPGTHSWMVLCLDLENGDILWQRTAYEGPAPSPIHPKNTFASATPVTDGERVYALFGNLGLFAYDFDGNLVWSRELSSRTGQGHVGTGSSPTLLGDQLLVVLDNGNESYLASFDTTAGSENWRVARGDDAGFSTPVVWRNDLRTEIVTAGKNQVRSYDPSGNLLWFFSGRMTQLTVPTPVPGDGIIYVSSGYVGDNHRPVYAVLPGAEGDITMRPNQRANEYIRWYQPRVASYQPSPVLYRGIYYTLHDRGFFTAHDARTGRTVYDRVRIETGATFTASPWAYNGKIFALSEDGDTYVIEAGPEFRLVGKNPIGEMALASPAVAGTTVVLRTVSHVYGIRR